MCWGQWSVCKKAKRKFCQHFGTDFQGISLESSSKDLPNIYQRFTKNLPSIYQKFTKNKAIFGILPSKNLPKIYQRITKDLPKTYQRFTESTEPLPKAYQEHFSIYQRFTNNLPKMFLQKYFDTSIIYFIKNI